MKPDIGTYFELADSVAARKQASLSFLNFRGSDVEQWRTQARAKVLELMAFNPEPCPMNATVDDIREEDGLVIESISYNLGYGPRARGFFLRPAGATGRLPAVVALHDHGAFKWFGKEKIAPVKDEPPILREFKERFYGGRSWAAELARRGFAVLVVDLFVFGSRKFAVESLPEEFAAGFRGLEPGSREYIEAYHAFAYAHEELLARTLFAAGTTWPGIYTYEDRRSVDYLLTREEVDPERIACGGLSLGGLRTIFLAGLDARIRVAVGVGFMSTWRALLYNHIKCHSWIVYVPRLPDYLDLPDVISLRVPAPLMVQYDEDDELFTLEGQREADAKIAAIYEKSGHPDHYRGCFYPGPHKFDLQMQEEAFSWFERWLKG